MQTENEQTTTQKPIRQKKKLKIDPKKNLSAIQALSNKDHALALEIFAELLPLSEIDDLLENNSSPASQICSLAYNYGLSCLESYKKLQDENHLLLAEKLLQLSLKYENKNSRSWQRNLWVIKKKLFEIFRFQLDLYLTTNVEQAEIVLKKMLTECKALTSMASQNKEKTEIIYDLISEFISKTCTEADNASKNDKIMTASTYYLSSIDYINYQKTTFATLLTAADLKELETKKADILYNLMDMNRSINSQLAQAYASVANTIYTTLLSTHPTNENYKSGFEVTKSFVDDNQTTLVNPRQHPSADVIKIPIKSPPINDGSSSPLIVPEPQTIQSGRENLQREPEDLQKFLTDLDIESSLLELDIPTLNAINKKIKRDIETSSTEIKEIEERIVKSTLVELNLRYAKLSQLHNDLFAMHMLSETEKKDLEPISQTVSEYSENKVQFGKIHFSQSTQTVKAQLEKVNQDIDSVTDMINYSDKKKRKIASITTKIGIQASWKNDLPIKAQESQKKEKHFPKSPSRKSI